MAACVQTARDKRSHFWTTQPTAGGVEMTHDSCGTPHPCGVAGLVVQPLYDDCDQQQLGCYADADGSRPRPKLIGASIATNDFVRGLALNILLTDQQRQPIGACRPTPGKRGGYWADAYRANRLKTGTRLRQLPAAGSIVDLVKLAQQYAQADLQKLVTYGVATTVVVTTSYLGGGAIALKVEIDGDITVSVTGQKSANEWFWAA